jgi:hypothetical protein
VAKTPEQGDGFLFGFQQGQRSSRRKKNQAQILLNEKIRERQMCQLLLNKKPVWGSLEDKTGTKAAKNGT